MSKVGYLLVVSLILPVIVSAADDFCAVRLRVQLRDGTPVPISKADLIDPAGRIVQSRDVVEGKAEFCDFGFGMHSIRVHAGTCTPVVLERVRLYYRFTRTYDLIQNCYPGPEDGDGVANGCFIYLRVQSVEGATLPEIEIRDAETNYIRGTTDKYGRAQVSILKGRSLMFAFIGKGLETRKMDIACPAAGGGIREVLVELRRNSK